MSTLVFFTSAAFQNALSCTQAAEHRKYLDFIVMGLN